MNTLDFQVGVMHATMEVFADIKRFNERWLSDPDFRALSAQDPERAVECYGLAISADGIRESALGEAVSSGAIGKGIFAMTAAKAAVMKSWYGPDAEPDEPRFAAWRSRQRHRMRLQLGPFPTNSSIRAAWHAELTRGCSGGCWFCNMAAEPLSARAPSDASSLSEWRAIVRMLNNRLGNAVRTGFLDGATDPFDHPEYEQLCEIVLEEASFYPPTATALALQDIDRSRRFFARAREAGCWSIRLTVRTRDELDQLHEAFTSQELSHVQINVMTPESTFVFSLAGRYRERFLADPEFAKRETAKLRFAPWYTADRSYQDAADYPFDANTAVTGFRLDMVGRTIALVVPRPSTSEFPLGLQILDTRKFEDVTDLERALDEIIERWMPRSLPSSAKVACWPGLEIERISGGVRFHGRFRQFADISVDQDAQGAFEYVIEHALAGDRTLDEFIAAAPAEESKITFAVQQLFDAGLLDDVPGDR